MSHDRTMKVLVSNKGTAGTATTPATLTEGEIAFLKQDGTFLTAGETISDSAVITPVMGTSTLGAPKYGVPIQGANVKKYEGKGYAAAVEQVSYIGDNGTTGDINPVTGELEYSVHLEFLQEVGLFSERQHRRTITVKYDALPSALSLQNDLIAAINADVEAKKYVTAAAETGGGNNGIKLTGKALTYNRLNGYEQVSFKVSLDKGFNNTTQVDEFGYIYVNGAAGTTTNAASVAATPGSGTYELVATLEEDAVGFDGALNRIGFPADAPYKAAASGANYNVFVIEHEDVHESASLDGKIGSSITTVIAVEAGAAGSEDEALQAKLNPWMNSTPKVFPTISL